MTKTEALEICQEIVSRIVGVVGVCVLISTIAHTTIQWATVQPNMVAGVIHVEPTQRTQTFFKNNSSGELIEVSSDGERSITRIDKRQFIHLTLTALSGLGLLVLRWPIARILIPNPAAKKSPQLI